MKNWLEIKILVSKKNPSSFKFLFLKYFKIFFDCLVASSVAFERFKANMIVVVVAVVYSLSHNWFFAIPWTAACQASLSLTIFQSLLKLMFIKVVMLANHLIPCHPFSSYPQSSPESGSFLMSWLFQSGGQSTGASSSASFLLVNIQGWFPLGLTGLISLLFVSKYNFGLNTLQSVAFLWQFNSCYQWEYLLVRFL